MYIFQFELPLENLIIAQIRLIKIVKIGAAIAKDYESCLKLGFC
ncbi:MAG: hypothetical protein RLZZ28_477 [Bacteroidota bacterium]